MTPEEQREAIAVIRKSLEGRQKPLQVLLIEDDANDAECTLSSLRQVGIDVYWAKTADEVGDFLLKKEPRMAFLDLNLRASGMDSIQVLKIIQTCKPDCRVVVLTGAYRHDSVECNEALKEGAIAAMLKPLTHDQIQLIFGTPSSV